MKIGARVSVGKENVHFNPEVEESGSGQRWEFEGKEGMMMLKALFNKK